MCSAHFQRSVHWVSVMFVHVMCTQCVVVWLQRMDVWDFVLMHWLHKAHCHLLLGPGFRSTSPLRSSRATSQPAGGRRLGAEKTADLGTPFGGKGEGVVIYPPIREGYSNRAQATTFGALFEATARTTDPSGGSGSLRFFGAEGCFSFKALRVSPS